MTLCVLLVRLPSLVEGEVQSIRCVHGQLISASMERKSPRLLRTEAWVPSVQHGT